MMRPCYFLAGLGEFRLRDLNDEINKLLREKRHWEYRILELGGRDHRVSVRRFAKVYFHSRMEQSRNGAKPYFLSVRKIFPSTLC